MKCVWCGNGSIEPQTHVCKQLIEGAPGLHKAQRESGLQLELFADTFPPGALVECDRPEQFIVKDSGAREQFDSGMVRDTTEGKIDYTLALDGPMFQRYAEHLTKGAHKYEKRNWLKAEGQAEYERFRESAFRHMMKWYYGLTDEDHAAAVIFNLNGAEYVKGKLDG